VNEIKGVCGIPGMQSELQEILTVLEGVFLFFGSSLAIPNV